MSNLDKNYWDEMREKYPEEADYFLRWVEQSFTQYEKMAEFTIEDFYQMPLSMQLGWFYEFICAHHRNNEVVAAEVWKATIQKEFSKSAKSGKDE